MIHSHKKLCFFSGRTPKVRVPLPQSLVVDEVLVIFDRKKFFFSQWFSPLSSPTTKKNFLQIVRLPLSVLLTRLSNDYPKNQRREGTEDQEYCSGLQTLDFHNCYFYTLSFIIHTFVYFFLHFCPFLSRKHKAVFEKEICRKSTKMYE